MPRPALHTEESILDAARQVVLQRGLRSTTVTAIAETSGASMGSIYHRFISVDDLLARLWIRAAQRAQDALLAGLTAEDLDGMIDGALAVYDFCLREPEDALLLASFALTDFDQSQLPSEVQAQLRSVNDPITPVYARLAQALGAADGFDMVQLVLVDLPFGAARRHAQARRVPSPERRALLGTALRAVLNERCVASQEDEALS